jgi:hypothetical protein
VKRGEEMDPIITLETKVFPSEEIVARVIDDDIIIIPLAAGIGDMEDEMYSLNETGRAIWDKLDGEHTLAQIADNLAEEFDAPNGEIQKDILGLVTELYRRKIVIQK